MSNAFTFGLTMRPGVRTAGQQDSPVGYYLNTRPDVRTAGQQDSQPVWATKAYLMGNGGNNILTGGDGHELLSGRGGNDQLKGGLGSDWLKGGSGKDQYVYSSADEGGDVINDFSVRDDKFVFSTSGFGFQAGQPLVAGQTFIANEAPAPLPGTDGQGVFLYDTNDHNLLWDADGSGLGAAVNIAHLNGKVALTADHFIFEGTGSTTGQGGSSQVPPTTPPTTGQGDSSQVPPTTPPTTGQGDSSQVQPTTPPTTGQGDSSQVPPTTPPTTGQGDSSQVPPTTPPTTGQSDSSQVPPSTPPTTGQGDSGQVPPTTPPTTGQGDSSQVPPTTPPTTGQGDSSQVPPTTPPTTGQDGSTQADPVQLVHSTTPIYSSYDGQIIENLDLYVTSGNAITVTNDNVIIRNVRVHHEEGHGIALNGASNVTIENTEVINSSPPTGTNAEGPNGKPNPDWVDPNINNIYALNSPDLTVDHVTVRDGATGIELVNSPGANLSNVEGYNFHGPAPRGDFVQFAGSGNSSLTDFYAYDDPAHSRPEDIVSVYNSPNVTISRGLIVGNTSAYGNAITFEENSGGGKVDHVDAVDQASGSFVSWGNTGGTVSFDYTRDFDHIITDQGRGLPGSKGVIWAADPAAGSHISVQHSTYTNHPGGGSGIAYDQHMMSPMDIHEDPNAVPMIPPVTNHFEWN